jgi:hypothetical protein
MWRSSAVGRRADQALASRAHGAGLALACAFSSSDEYEAAVILGRRIAGAYGFGLRMRWSMIVTARRLIAGAAERRA